jgi:hypothetical protein
MRHYNVWQLGIVLGFLGDAQAVAHFRKGTTSDSPVPRERIDQYYKPSVEYAQRQCADIELSAALHRCDLFLIALRDGILWSELGHQAQALLEAIEGELKYRRFAFVQTPKAKILDEFRKDWATVLETFPNAEEDVKHAVECYALEQNTACVFHLMRVAEHGLRAVGKRVGVKLTDKGKPQPIEFATWEKVIAAIKNKITAAHAMSKGVHRKQQLQFYSDAADQCAYIRDIWRNEVSHNRGSYNDGEAAGVMTRVRQFMELLAAQS